ncbi:algn-10 [Pristionchus pacificus]|uniref:Dol-P-Glc:Glc(2)Man(9)GlcNAc(2)-PP-Dol alpha-1,2-glucosyltransferase n=1 Tax=Pristionchus pacificus TaxID=54126 RepID=A0A8R1Z605_PRIPA|nr:algn-10 [Pristionchus pacificus]
MIGYNQLLRKYGPVSIFIGLVHCSLVSLVYKIVPDPYMDEIFHIGQTRRYCQGNYTWDPMITTPPGLYILAIPLFCGKERYLNSLLYPCLFLAACRYRSRFTRSIDLTVLIVISLPVLLHSSLLFYTDTLSLLLTLLAFSSPPSTSSFFFLLSLTVRQTNIGWAFLYAASLLISSISPSSILQSSINSLFSLSPFIVLGLSFISFVYINGSIVLGDPSAHHPVLHLSQLIVFFLFCACHVWPHILTLCSSIFSYTLRPSSLPLLAMICLSLYSFYYTHPYLLSDNRHIPFHLHRRIFSSTPIRLLLSIPALLSIASISHISSSSPRFIRLLFILSTSLILIPAHLLEFRYFITPFILWRLYIPPPSSSFTSILELISNMAVFIFVFLLFLFKPFEWPHEPHILQRFMW